MTHHRFLDSDFQEPDEPSFSALGRPGSDHYVGLETFENPGCVLVSMTSDEVMSICPITKQPDFYTVTIDLAQTEKLIESKSLKIWFQHIMENSFQNREGIFCESLAVHIRETMVETLGCEDDNVRVTLTQKSRGGISIKAVA